MKLRLSALAASIALLGALPAAAATDGPWYMDPAKGFALLSLFIFFAIVWRAGGFRIIAGALDSRGSDIETRMEEARNLRDQATKMLADAERKQKAAKEEAEQIVAQAERDAKAMLAQAKADLEQKIERRFAAAQERIALAEKAATEDVRRAAADAATRAARDLLAGETKLDTFETAAAQIEKALN